MSGILPQRNSNSVEKLIRYSFIHKGFLIHEDLSNLSIYIAFLVPSLEQMNGTSYEVSIFCSTHFYHPIANFPCEIKYNNKFKNVYPWIHYHDHIELFKIATLKKISRRRLATSNDYFDCSGYIERIHPLHLRYRNMFCCYTILMDVFPWPPNQFDTHPWDSLQ